MNRKFLVEVQFDGSHYNGFQKNGNSNTIQLQLETALKKLFLKEITIIGCSRTDKGVSANQFYFTFEVDTKLPADRIAFKLNRFLPKTIQCQSSKEIAREYNLRNSVISKTYCYSIYTGSHIQPLLNLNKLFVEGELDIQIMKECAKELIGKHNFKSFCNQNSDTTSFVREIFDITIEQKDNQIDMNFSANNFLYNMVRILAGTLIDCGKNKLTKQDIIKLLQQKDRSQNLAKTLPAKGLVLQKIQLK